MKRFLLRVAAGVAVALVLMMVRAVTHAKPLHAVRPQAHPATLLLYPQQAGEPARVHPVTSGRD